MTYKLYFYKLISFKLFGLSSFLIFSLKVLFIFDTRFVKEFEGKEGKTADEHMNEAMKVVKNAYADRTLRSDIGTTVNVIAEKKIHPRPM